MSVFHESIKTLLSEVEKFLLETLKHEKLGKSSKTHKQEIVDKINKLKEEWPALGMLNTDQVKQSKDLPKDDESTRTGGSSNADDAEDPYVDSTADIPNVPAMELTDFTKAGYLEKKRPSGLKTMQKRWCVIKGNVFYYFSEKTSKKMSGAFRLTDYSFEGAPDIVKDEKKKELCFKLVRPANRTYEFMAPNKSDFEEWKTAVKKVSAMTIETAQIDDMDDGDIYEPVGDDANIPEPIQEDFYDDGMEGDIYEAEPVATRSEPEPIQDDIYDEGASAPVEEEEYEDASTAPVPPSAPPPRGGGRRPPPPPVPDEDPYQTRPLPPITPRKTEDAPIPPPPRKADELPPPPPPVQEEPKSYRNQEDFENMFIGKWDCTGDNEKELSFKKGDVVYIINRDFDNKSWWVGELNGKFGLVPKNYLSAAYEVAF